MTWIFGILSFVFLGLAIGLTIWKSLNTETVKFGVGVPWLIASVLVFLLTMSWTEVDAGTVGVVTEFGQAMRVLAPGVHLIAPIIEECHPISTQTLVVKPNEDGASHDLQMVHTQVTLAYHFDPKYAMFFYTQLIDSSTNAVENKVILPAIIEAVKSLTAQYDAQALITQRPAVRDGIEAFVKSRIADYHIVAETVSITDFNFSPEFNQAIESKVTAQQNAEKATNDLTRIKVEADQKVAAAEGEAKALKVQKEQITPELLQLRTIEMLGHKWDGHLPENYYGGNAPLPIVDVFKNVGVPVKK